MLLAARAFSSGSQEHVKLAQAGEGLLEVAPFLADAEDGTGYLAVLLGVREELAVPRILL